MYIIISKPNTTYNLGHELHFSRKLLLLLFYYNYINNDAIIITIYEDRKFLYSKIFKVITYDEFTFLNNIDLNDIIDLSDYLTLGYGSDIIITNDLNKLLKMDDINGKTLNDMPFINDPINNDFIDLCLKIDYINFKKNKKKYIKKIIKQNFCIIHIKQENTDNNLLLINNIIESLNDIKCIIFTQKKDFITKNKTISDLHLYASLMNHPNCKYIISEWSGGGQLSQYCCNSKIYYYYSFYQEPDETSDFCNVNLPKFSEQQNWYDIIYNKTKELENWSLMNKFSPLSDHFNPSNVNRIFLLKKELINYKFI